MLFEFLRDYFNFELLPRDNSMSLSRDFMPISIDSDGIFSKIYMFDLELESKLLRLGFWIPKLLVIRF